ncbi:DUF4124 domain-containing protein [Massilia sp. IC2-476]|uniref:DUF4124 domain-containing protein n=1 Tax=Massilia sp. IC2-476 TaxID=2887199 RepID=UPI001D12E795|nr:DUF4124 domain-containing protein [Massilia sp. IC2-476]MCC2974506.1 DUF4124 domain-containing protein [Massilia sp. IC2-476]
MLKHVLAAALWLAAGAATADTIYKCNEGGRISYHDRPCGQNAVALKVQTPAPAPEALERLARERAMLQEIEDARLARDEQEARAGTRAERLRQAASSQKRRCDKLRLQQKWLEEEEARTRRDADQGSERARSKARRQAELLAVECPA